ncbi:MAG: ABC transporter permease [Alicyclobacillus sp.]|nr:ABC transporter permease [Alicyclobacillus sp.]
MSPSRAWHLGMGMLWKLIHEQRVRVLSTPLMIVALILFISFCVIYIPEYLSPQTIPLLQSVANSTFSIHDGRQALIVAVIFGFGPYVMAVLVSNMAASNTQGNFATESFQGGLELLLSGPYKLSEIFAALLISSLGLTFAVCVIVALCIYGLAGLIMGIFHVSFPLSGDYIVLVLLMPLAMGICSGVLSLLISILFPTAAKMRTGGSGNLGRLLSIIPSLVFLVFLSVDPKVNVLDLAVVALCVGVLGAAAVVSLFGRWFRPEFIVGR